MKNNKSNISLEEGKMIFKGIFVGVSLGACLGVVFDKLLFTVPVCLGVGLIIGTVFEKIDRK